MMLGHILANYLVVNNILYINIILLLKQHHLLLYQYYDIMLYHYKVPCMLSVHVLVFSMTNRAIFIVITTTCFLNKKSKQSLMDQCVYITSALYIV